MLDLESKQFDLNSALPFIGVFLSKLHNTQSLSFFICKLGIIVLFDPYD